MRNHMPLPSVLEINLALTKYPAWLVVCQKVSTASVVIVIAPKAGGAFTVAERLFCGNHFVIVLC